MQGGPTIIITEGNRHLSINKQLKLLSVIMGNSDALFGCKFLWVDLGCVWLSKPSLKHMKDIN